MSVRSASRLRHWVTAKLTVWRDERRRNDEFVAQGHMKAEGELLEAGLEHEDPREIVTRRLKASRHLRGVMAAIGIDHRLLDRGQPEALHHLEFACTTCRSWRRCKKELARGTLSRNFERFCPNAQGLKAIREVMSWVREPEVG